MLDKKHSLSIAPENCGVYIMQDSKEKIIYVGKAKNLRQRLRSYFASSLSIKTSQLMKTAVKLQVVVTTSENESLLLEDRLIKKHMPKFNVLLRDDKSYPYLWFSNDNYPLLSYRNRKISQQGEYFGPYISKNILRYSLELLEKTFQLRTCSKAFFNARKKPCIKHQIGYCSAPCMGLISEENYQNKIKQAKAFLSNEDFSIIEELSKKMQLEATEERFESAALIRDKINKLRVIQQERNQAIIVKSQDIDVWGMHILGNYAFINLLRIRNGAMYASLPFRSENINNSDNDIMVSTLKQYYLSLPASDIVGQILLQQDCKELLQFVAFLSTRNQIKQIKIRSPKSKLHKQWAEMSIKNALLSSEQFSQKKQQFKFHLASLATQISMETINKIECFDVSHFSGQHTVGAMTVCTLEGLQKNLYRSFSIDTVNNGDDYAATQEAISRRMAYVYDNSAKNYNSSLKTQPDLLLIDGGIGQINAAIKALKEQKIKQQTLLGIAKGVTRKAINERYFICHYNENNKINIKEIFFANLPFVLQLVRDKAHNHAISKSRKKLIKGHSTSLLSQIAGVGKNRQKQLLIYFGSLEKIKQASVADIAKLPAIGKKLATSISDYLKNS